MALPSSSSFSFSSSCGGRGRCPGGCQSVQRLQCLKGDTGGGMAKPLEEMQVFKDPKVYETLFSDMVFV